MLYWIIYDICSNKIRNKIGNICKNYGMIRIQKSAFAGEVTKNKIEMLVLQIKELLLGPKDCIFVLPNCNSCFNSKEIIGELDEEKIRDRNWVIIQK